MSKASEIVAALLETEPEKVDVKHYIDAVYQDTKNGKVTPQAAMTASRFYHRTLRYKSRNAPIEARRNGSTQTWKTRPGKFRIPVKIGFREYYNIDNYNAHEWSTIPDPPNPAQ